MTGTFNPKIFPRKLRKAFKSLKRLKLPVTVHYPNQNTSWHQGIDPDHPAKLVVIFHQMPTSEARHPHRKGYLL